MLTCVRQHPLVPVEMYNTSKEGSQVKQDKEKKSVFREDVGWMVGLNKCKTFIQESAGVQKSTRK